ncbi:hypothetical protein ACFLYX_00825 [Chloroflexota bacterium]
MFKNTLLEVKRSSRCQRCGGQLIRYDDEISCLQCSAPHTRDGKLAIYSVREFYYKHGLRDSALDKRTRNLGS